MKKTQILATIGPASINKIGELYHAGLSGIRINSSHGNFIQHKKIIRSTRRISKNIFTIYDIKGPKIRIGDLKEPVHLKSGMEIILKTGLKKNRDGYPYTTNIRTGIPVTFESLHAYLKPDDRLMLDDGLIGLKVISIKSGNIHCLVMYGDILRSRKGINHPDTIINFPYTVKEDIPKIEFGIENKADYIADSFVRNGEDVDELRDRLKNTKIKIISKIENPEGVRNFDDILDRTDAIMIARGDLGVELKPWEIPEKVPFPVWMRPSRLKNGFFEFKEAPSVGLASSPTDALRIIALPFSWKLSKSFTGVGAWNGRNVFIKVPIGLLKQII